MTTAASDSAKGTHQAHVQDPKTKRVPLARVAVIHRPGSDEMDDEYEITATVVDTEQLNWWLRGFGDAVRDVDKQPLD